MTDFLTKPTPQGQRKVKHAREQGFILFLGFAVAVWMKAPTELFVAFVVGLTGISGAFVYGNTKVHQAQTSEKPTL